ncbi:hypothetical protein B0H14DRAFT_3857444 [Mycena olivaceomarginata]|nr:hypothetical protein B0H14DRAFT_3857444 [Mycena olivaceomarginata]
MAGGPQTRAKLQIDPSAKACASTPSPSSASTTLSALSPLTTRPSSAGSHTTEEEDEKGVKSDKSDPEKPKRSRVTPEQLVHLERFFAVERSPTASRRREIGERLGMQERQHRSGSKTADYPEETNLIRSIGYRRRSYAANDLSQLVVSGLSHYRRDLPHCSRSSVIHPHIVSAALRVHPSVEPILAAEEHSLEDYGARPVSHDMTPRPYSAQPVPPHFYEKSSPSFQSMYYRDHQIGLC